MLQYQLAAGQEAPSILVLGAHCDDIEIGCAGALCQLVARHPHARILWVTLSSDETRKAETRDAARRILRGATKSEVRVETFRGSYFPDCVAELKDYFEDLKQVRPDLIFTHYRADLHQDHRVTNELTWNTFRDHRILEYEIPKFDGDIGVPNVFVPLTEAQMKAKCDMLLDCFPSQSSRKWFTRSTFEALARLRGIECNAPEGYAEAFHGRKLSLEL